MKLGILSFYLPELFGNPTPKGFTQRTLLLQFPVWGRNGSPGNCGGLSFRPHGRLRFSNQAIHLKPATTVFQHPPPAVPGTRNVDPKLFFHSLVSPLMPSRRPAPSRRQQTTVSMDNGGREMTTVRILKQDLEFQNFLSPT